MTEATKGVVQKYIKGATKDFFIVGSWFSSKKAAGSEMEVGDKLIGMVKKNSKGFCKETIVKIANDWLGGSYLVFRSNPMVPGAGHLLLLATSIKRGRFNILLLQKTQGSHRQVFPIYLSILTNLLMLPFALLLVPFSCQGFLLLLMRLTPTTSQGNLIWHWIISG